jgi:hypothetical protein
MEVSNMRFFVKAEAFESIVRYEDIKVAREDFAKQLHHIHESGKLVAGGIYADGRGGVFILSVDSAQELFHLLMPGIIEHFRIESRPLVTFDDLFSIFAEQKIG